MPSIQNLFVNLIQAMADDMIRAVDATPKDKAVWKPLETGRSIQEIALECAGVNLFMAKAISTYAAPVMDREEFAKFTAEHDTLEKSVAALKSSLSALSAAIICFPTEKLDDTILLPFPGGTTVAFAELISKPYYHLSYHLGQINYIQTLYGDKAMH